jgi:spore germination cell wall hydrolase CwlJ-like protein
MQITANKPAAVSILHVIRAICFIIGLWVVISAVQFAIDRRADSYYNTVPSTSMSAREVQQQLTCLSRNIYWEAASEPFEGKVAVAQVTMNRMTSGKFPDTVCGVVHQKTSFLNNVVCQFSWLCEDTYKTKPIHQPLYKESEEVAKMVMLEGFRLKGLEKALYYHADYVNPKWNKEKVTKIGRHIFYKDKE